MHNHVTALDNVGIIGVLEGTPFSYLSKAELFWYPGLGLILKFIKSVPIQWDNRE